MEKEKYINKIIQGDALKTLKQMPDNFVDMVLCSPPYWSLRCYGTEGQIWDEGKNCKHDWKLKKDKLHSGRGDTQKSGKYSEQAPVPDVPTENAFCSKCGAWRGELGLEPDFNLYIKHLCDIFDEVKRVLKDTGTIWINIGDSYGGVQGKNAGWPDSKTKANVPQQLKPEKYTKCLMGIPERFVLEMIDNRGWTRRNTAIWYKPNCMPSSAADRFTVDFEYLYFFSKQKKYYFEQQFEEHLSEPPKEYKNTRGFEKKPNDPKNKNPYFCGKSVRYGEQGRNKRCVWEITTQPYKEAHFAVYPEELCIIPIKVGCPEFICKKCGKPREKILEPTEEYAKRLGKSWHDHSDDKGKGLGHQLRGDSNKKPRVEGIKRYNNKGYTDCGCGAGHRGGVVLDPFSGAGTTCLVAKKLGRNYIGIDVKKEYCNMAERRIHNECGLL